MALLLFLFIHLCPNETWATNEISQSISTWNFQDFFRGSMPLIAAVIIFIKKQKTRQELMGRLRQAAVDAGQPEKLGCCGFRDGQLIFATNDPKKGSQEAEGVWAPAKRPLNTARTDRKTPSESKPFNIRVEKHLCCGVFWRVFLEGFFFYCKGYLFFMNPKWNLGTFDIT